MNKTTGYVLYFTPLRRGLFLITMLFALAFIPRITMADCCGLPVPEYLAPYYTDAAQEYPDGLTRCELMRQGYYESAFQADVESPAGALGIAQFEPETAQELGIDPLDPEASIHAQAKYMARLMHVWYRHTDRDERVALALASYNWGVGNMIHNQHRHDWNSWVEAEPYMPDETRKYVKHILRKE